MSNKFTVYQPNMTGYNPRTVWRVNFTLKIPGTKKLLIKAYEVPPGHEYTTLMKSEIVEYDWETHHGFKAVVSHIEKDCLSGLSPDGKTTEHLHVWLDPI